MVAQLPHPDDLAKQKEHLALYDLVPRTSATHTTIASGAWNVASTWKDGLIPGANAKVVVASGHTVTYNVSSNTAMDWVRVDGTLTFDPTVDTRMVTESLIVDPAGAINIGTPSARINAARTAEVVIDTSRGPISRTADPLVLSRGFITHGATQIYGAEKKPHTTLLNQALAGSTVLRLSDTAIPQGWNVGDILLVAGTEADLAETGGVNLFGVNSSSVSQDANNTRFKDELLRITGINVVNGQVEVTFANITNATAISANSTSLLWDHKRPSGSLFNASELSVHVANLTRNVVVRSSHPSVPNQERGHFMVMHNPNAKIYHAQFKDLGRTDKSITADDPAALGNFDGTASTGTNPRGRYALHIHRVGATSYGGTRAEIVGNAVWGSPGWGIVHHDSHAYLDGNVVFDVVGAGIVAEDGSELGEWRNNLAIKMTGAPASDFDDNFIATTGRASRFDLGFVGSGYWIQGGAAGLVLQNNAAASCNAAGFDIVPKTGLTGLPFSTFSSNLIRIPALRQDLIDAGISSIAINAVPASPIDGIVVYNSFRGIHTWLFKRDSQDKEYKLLDSPYTNHPYSTFIRNFKIWNVLSGVQNLYSQSMIFQNGLVVGNVASPFPLRDSNDSQGNNQHGVAFSHNANDAHTLHLDGIRIEGFAYAVQIPVALNSDTSRHVPYAVGSIRNSQAANIRFAFIPNASGSTQAFYPYFEIDNCTFTSINANQPPTASFTTSLIGGYSVLFDASASSDPDKGGLTLGTSSGIAAYAWDFNGDGVSDAWGRDALYNFGSPGNRTVTLRVYDTHGASVTTTRTFNVSSQAYPNVLVDSTFTDATGARINTQRFADFKAVTSADRESGWLGHNFVNSGGFLSATGIPRLVQVVHDEYVLRGQQKLNLRLRQTASGGTPAALWVTVYGVNGQFAFDQNVTTATGPRRVPGSVLPMTSTVLMRANVGGVAYANWTPLELTGDFGNGYEYIVVHVAGTNQNISAGHVVQIDDVTLSGAAP